jgi:hypothetical protein
VNHTSKPNIIFCTYFDSNYYSRGLALINSVLLNHPDSKFLVLCLDNEVYNFLFKYDSRVECVYLSQLESSYPKLRECKDDRSLIEYYFTLTPFFLQYVSGKSLEEDVICYVDSDVYFYSNIDDWLLDDYSIKLVPHWIKPKSFNVLKKYGDFNVGIVPIKKGLDSDLILKWWGERCAEWCKDVYEEGKFADQAYLNYVPKLFSGVKISDDIGINVAPWNVGQYNLNFTNNEVFLDNKTKMRVFHFHNLKQSGNRFYSNLINFGVFYKPHVINKIYVPYINELEKNNDLFNTKINISKFGKVSIRKSQTLFGFVKYQALKLVSILLHQYIKLS